MRFEILRLSDEKVLGRSDDGAGAILDARASCEAGVEAVVSDTESLDASVWWWERSVVRCPHDGGFCHHGCGDGGVCFREVGGMNLTTPWPGYPLPGSVHPAP